MFAEANSSIVWTLVGWVCFLTVVILVERLRARHLQRRLLRGTAEFDAAQAEDPPSLLFPMFNAAQPPVAEVAIHQRGWSQGNWGLLSGWKEERDRTVSIRSFVLHLDDGRRVSVRTDSVNVRLACELEAASPFLPVDNGERWRWGIVRYGDRVLVDGELVDGGNVESAFGPYRNGDTTTVGTLRPHRDRPLWLMTESALARAARSRLTLHLLFVGLALATLIAILATAPIVVTLARKDQDICITIAWLAVIWLPPTWLYWWRRRRPWYERKRFNET